MSQSQPMISASMRISEALSMLSVLPASMAAVADAYTVDAMRHHRQSVLKHHSAPGGRRFQRYLASRLHVYGSKKKRPALADVQGGSFAAYRESPGDVSLLERGGTVRTSDSMVIPIEGGVLTGKSGVRNTSYLLKRGLENNTLAIVQSGRGPLIVHTAKSSKTKKHGFRGERSIVVGLLRKSRRQGKVIEFAEQWDRIAPRHADKFDGLVEMAQTYAGRESLRHKSKEITVGQKASKSAFESALKAGSTPRDARRAANAAARAARTLNLAKRRG